MTALNKFIIIAALLAIISCKKEADVSDITFNQTCNLPSSRIEVVNGLSGTLLYTNNIMDIPPAELPPNQEYVFLIRSAGRLQMMVCNMPDSFEMTEGSSRSIIFSGRVEVLADNVDATNTTIELKYLKFK